MTHFGTPNMEHIFNSSDSHRDLTLFGSIQTPGDPDSDPSDPGTLRFWDPQILGPSDSGPLRSWDPQILGPSDSGTLRFWTSPDSGTSDLGWGPRNLLVGSQFRRRAHCIWTIPSSLTPRNTPIWTYLDPFWTSIWSPRGPKYVATPIEMSPRRPPTWDLRPLRTLNMDISGPGRKS